MHVFSGGKDRPVNAPSIEWVKIGSEPNDKCFILDNMIIVVIMWNERV